MEINKKNALIISGSLFIGAGIMIIVFVSSRKKLQKSIETIVQEDRKDVDEAISTVAEANKKMNSILDVFKDLANTSPSIKDKTKKKEVIIEDKTDDIDDDKKD